MVDLPCPANLLNPFSHWKIYTRRSLLFEYLSPRSQVIMERTNNQWQEVFFLLNGPIP